MSKTEAPRPAKRFTVKIDSGREFIVYAPNRASAVQRLIEAQLRGEIVYETAGPVTLKSLGHVVNAQEATAGVKAKVLVDR
jgi:hypothetical protein